MIQDQQVKMTQEVEMEGPDAGFQSFPPVKEEDYMEHTSSSSNDITK